MHRVLVYEPIDPTGESLKWLEAQGVQLVTGPPMWQSPYQPLDERELIEQASGCIALMGGGATSIGRRLMEALPQLRYVSKCGIGYDSIDVEAATQLGILITNTPVHSEVEIVAEHTIALILALRKQLAFWTSARLQSGGWRDASCWAAPIRGSTIGIIGLGRIGRAVARRLQNWDVTILATDIVDVVPEAGVRLVELDALLSAADIVTLHADARPSNRNLLDERRIGSMKSGAVLVNAARGSLIDVAALARALTSGRLAGVALDVFDPEPPGRDYPLFDLPNVLLTPHVAAWTQEVLADMGWLGARNLWQMLNGEGPESLVNPEALDRSAQPR
jgi:D-3-phosphoglycerate dehydrogenase / 2-oxoglutarate reductase